MVHMGVPNESQKPSVCDVTQGFTHRWNMLLCVLLPPIQAKAKADAAASAAAKAAAEADAASKALATAKAEVRNQPNHSYQTSCAMHALPCVVFCLRVAWLHGIARLSSK
jgi:hypothetical protein